MEPAPFIDDDDKDDDEDIIFENARRNSSSSPMTNPATTATNCGFCTTCVGYQRQAFR
jgi:hypothetical protein